ncbi:MAG: 4Fe-4S binding protein [Candidatus Bathyarchaeia archaeon]
MKNKNKIRIKYWTFRMIVQFISFLFMYGLIFTIFPPYFKISRISIAIPVLVSMASPLSLVYGAFDLLQIMLSKPDAPLIAIASIMIVGSLFGRLFCGWICPMGFIQDLLSKLKSKAVQVSLRKHEFWKKLKFLILFFVLLISFSLALSLYLGFGEDYKKALGAFAYGPFLALSPDGTIFGVLPLTFANINRIFYSSLERNSIINYIWNGLMSLPNLFWIRILILIGFFYGSFRIARFWCRYLCPLGALMGIFGKFSLLGIKRNLLNCTHCPECEKQCPMQVKILELPWSKLNNSECILCLECSDACEKDAIGFKFP